MDFDGNFAVLDNHERHSSGFSSPIDMLSLDLHSVTQELEAEAQRLRDLLYADDDELLASERAAAVPELARVNSKRMIIAGIAAELSTRTAVEKVIEGAEQLLRQSSD